MFFLTGTKQRMVTAEDALPGRERPIIQPGDHAVLGTPMAEPYPDGMKVADFGLGCFWGAEKKFWQAPGVYTTAVGYQGGFTPHPTYEEVCTGRTGHTEVVRVVYDPDKTSYNDLLKLFWEVHDPTQGMRQGNDVGTQYRSAIYVHDEEQRTLAEHSREMFQPPLDKAGYGSITTEIAQAPPFYFAEEYHQQYLHKVPNGYDCHTATGLSCPI